MKDSFRHQKKYVFFLKKNIFNALLGKQWNKLGKHAQRISNMDVKGPL